MAFSDSYPPLPGSGTPSTSPKTAVDPSPRSVPDTSSSRPSAKPTKVLGESIANLPGARLKAPAAQPRGVDKLSLSSGVEQPGSSSDEPSGGLSLVRTALAVNRPVNGAAAISHPDAFAPGANGGIARWDSLRERFRKEHRLEPDEPLFALVAVIEEMELGLLTHIRSHRATTTDLMDHLQDAVGALDGTRDAQEQGNNLLSDLRHTIDVRLLPLLDALAVPRQVPLPDLPPQPAPQSGWWVSLCQWLRQLRE